MLFIIWFIKVNLFLCIILDYKNLKLKHFINNVVIDLWFYRNFASVEDIERKYNPILMDLLKLFPIKRYWVDL